MYAPPPPFFRIPDVISDLMAQAASLDQIQANTVDPMDPICGKNIILVVQSVSQKNGTVRNSFF